MPIRYCNRYRHWDREGEQKKELYLVGKMKTLGCWVINLHLIIKTGERTDTRGSLQ